MCGAELCDDLGGREVLFGAVPLEIVAVCVHFFGVIVNHLEFFF